MDTSDSRQRRIRTRRLLLAGLAGGFVVGVGILATHSPTESVFYPKCIFHQSTGLHCPGCGLTRAVHSLLNGKFRQALAYNAVGLMLLPFIAFSMANSLWAWVSEERLPSQTPSRPRRWLPWFLGTFLAAYWIARNLPFEPFIHLAPHELPENESTMRNGDSRSFP